MEDFELSYRVESEIDNTFPYLYKLDLEIMGLKKEIEKKEAEKKKVEFKKRSFFKKILKPMKEQEKEEKLKRKIMRHNSYFKDGYEFRIRLFKIFNEETEKIKHYEFSVNIAYDNIVKKDQFQKIFLDGQEAEAFFKDMKGFFKNLRRRDLIEKLIDEKLELIDNLKVQLEK